MKQFDAWNMKLRKRLAIFAMLWALPGAVVAADGTPRELVLVQSGTLPIILTAPHGGRLAIPGIAPRNIAGKRGGGDGYVTGSDIDTDRLAQAIAAEIKALTGRDAYLVIALFERKYIDANRPSEIAFDNPAAAPYYNHYHQSIRGFVDEIRKTHRAGLLIDVHGQTKFPDSLVRGTINGRAVTRLIARAGIPAVTGASGLFGLLEQNGFRVFPDNSMPPTGRNEDGGFNGGFTTNHYGSHRSDGIDAVQFEFGSKYRQRPAIDPSAKNAAKAIVAFYEAHLK